MFETKKENSIFWKAYNFAADHIRAPVTKGVPHALSIYGKIFGYCLLAALYAPLIGGAWLVGTKTGRKVGLATLAAGATVYTIIQFKEPIKHMIFGKYADPPAKIKQMEEPKQKKAMSKLEKSLNMQLQYEYDHLQRYSPAIYENFNSTLEDNLYG